MGLLLLLLLLLLPSAPSAYLPLRAAACKATSLSSVALRARFWPAGGGGGACTGLLEGAPSANASYASAEGQVLRLFRCSGMLVSEANNKPLPLRATAASGESGLHEGHGHVSCTALRTSQRFCAETS